ncbi:MAG: DUF488 domain-containing protein [Flavobacteriaceae bacterium]|nr:DUF488 domain-containing protein [Flavobacteriaceae bacterium]
MKNIQIKRIYEKAETSDGFRVLVDRIWPRGISKEEANLDEWLKDIAPSAELRQWFDHKEERFDEFKEKYISQLKDKTQEINYLNMRAKTRNLTLVYAAKDEKHNQAIILQEILEQKP